MWLCGPTRWDMYREDMGTIIHTDTPAEASLMADTDTTIRVIEAVASAKDIDPLDCPPLYDRIDPSALNDLFRGKENANGYTTFEYAGYVVMIDSSQTVTLIDLDESDESPPA